MINAGDAGYTTITKEFNNMISGMKPDIWFVGGDNAYDDNLNTCFYTWDWYLGDIEKIFSEIGYMFPIVWAVGNHDVGLNELPGINITKSLAGPPYLTYFP